jgi:hypothetical protein
MDLRLCDLISWLCREVHGPSESQTHFNCFKCTFDINRWLTLLLADRFSSNRAPKCTPEPKLAAFTFRFLPSNILIGSSETEIPQATLRSSAFARRKNASRPSHHPRELVNFSAKALNYPLGGLRFIERSLKMSRDKTLEGDDRACPSNKCLSQLAHKQTRFITQLGGQRR